MRLFVGVEPSPKARNDLADRLDAIDLAPARPLPRERWHITLAFLGEVAEYQLPHLTGRLAGVASSSGPMSLTLSGAGAFPSVGRPSVLWVGLAGDVAALRDLATEVAVAVSEAGVVLEGRPFAAHLTIARFPDRSPRAARPALTGLSSYAGPLFAVEEVRLMRSRLGRHPQHEPLAVWRLGPVA